MNRVVIFGKPAGGKSTFSQKLSAARRLPLCHLDLLVYQSDGSRTSLDDFNMALGKVLAEEQWVIDGFVTHKVLERCIEQADTLIYIDFPYWRHYLWSIKRCLKSFWVSPQGWPKRNPILKSTIQTWRHLYLSPTYWNDSFLEKLNEWSESKQMFHVRSLKESREVLKV